MPRVHVDMDGYHRIGRLMRRMFRRARTLHSPEVFNDVAEAVAMQNRLVFRTEGEFARGHRPWAPLSPIYAAWKVRMVGNRPILVFSGQLREGLTQRPMNVEIMASEYFEFGTADPIAKFHQYGTRHMPARPPVTTSEWLDNELARIAADHLTK